MEDKKLIEFISKNKKELIRTIWRYIRKKEDMEDVLQEVIIITWKKRSLFQSHSNPLALLKKISINISIDHLRKESKKK